MGGRQSRVQPSPRNYVLNGQIPSSPFIGHGSMDNEKMRKDTSNKATNYHNTKVVKDNSKHPECCEEPPKESTYQMVHNPNSKIQVIVDVLPARNRISLQITDWDTVKIVKEKIQQQEGIPEDQQMLVHAGKMLLDDCTLASYGIRRWAVLQMLIHPLPKIHVSVVTPKNDIIVLEVHIWSTIQDIKNLIAGTVVVQPDRQKLMYGGKQLNDHDILADHGFESALHVVFSPIQIFIKMWSGKTITIEVEPFDKVVHVIAKIENKELISLKHQSLTYGGRRLDSERTMADYKIEKESTLYLVMAASLPILRTIRIKSMTVETMSVEALLTDTIAIVKFKIYLKYGIRASAQILKHLGKELHDDQRVGDCNIQSNHILSLNYVE